MCVNVNTTDATTGATALLLPAQNIHTPYTTPYETRSMRALATLSVCVGPVPAKVP